MASVKDEGRASEREAGNITWRLRVAYVCVYRVNADRSNALLSNERERKK